MLLKTISEISHALKKKEFSCVELTKIYLSRIKTLNPALNAFITITEETALNDAHQADQRIALGSATPLTGIPIAHKDMFCTQGIKTSCGSKMLDNFISPYDATVVQKLKEAGAVLLGKTNMDEFSMGSSNEHSFYGPVRNPWNLEAVPGGSSGGSAAVVAARLTLAATGADAGGSIRQPAAFTNVTGLKPTYGRVSRYGMIAFASSFDQGGTLTRSAEDAAMLLNVIAGMDPKDSTSSNQPVPDFTQTLNATLKKVRIGLPKEFFTDPLDPKIADLVLTAAQTLEKMGATLHDLSLPHTPLAIPTYHILSSVECASNLARYDGIRFGHCCEHPKDIDDWYERSRAEGFGLEVKHRILMGTYLSSKEGYEDFYIKAQKVRRLIANDYIETFKKVDLILSPTTPTTAFKIGSKPNRVAMYLSDLLTASANLAGLPSLSIPCGFLDNMPVGLLLTGKPFDEARLLNAAHQYQRNADWHRRLPKEFS
ncbi:MAG: Asp-tRNA(Asn)/Glu-tRNA(Gln) amidotransferase subunit GatA [Pseudomonadota bacterium]